MRFRFKVSPRASRQIRAAAEWWVVNRTAAPTMLADELEAAFAFIEELPYAGEPVRHPTIRGLRRVFLGQSRYHLYYVVSEDEGAVEVLSLWHTRRGTPPVL